MNQFFISGKYLNTRCHFSRCQLNTRKTCVKHPFLFVENTLFISSMFVFSTKTTVIHVFCTLTKLLINHSLASESNIF